MSIEIKTKVLPMGFVNQKYSCILEAKVSPERAIVWSKTEESFLPLGLTFTSDGKLEGIPERSGLYTLDVIAETDFPFEKAIGILNIKIYSELIIKNKKLENLKSGSYNEILLLADGGIPPYIWSCDSLPLGVELRGSYIKGIPKVKGGVVSVCIKVIDYVGNVKEKYFTLSVI